MAAERSNKRKNHAHKIPTETLLSLHAVLSRLRDFIVQFQLKYTAQRKSDFQFCHSRFSQSKKKHFFTYTSHTKYILSVANIFFGMFVCVSLCMRSVVCMFFFRLVNGNKCTHLLVYKIKVSVVRSRHRAITFFVALFIAIIEKRSHIGVTNHTKLHRKRRKIRTSTSYMKKTK